MNKEIYDYVTQNEVNKNVLKTLGDESGGSSDFSIANLKLVDAKERGSGIQNKIGIRCDACVDDALRFIVAYCPVSGEITIPIPLYKRKNISITPEDLIEVTSMPALSGDIEYSETDEMFIITGDCSITVS